MPSTPSSHRSDAGTPGARQRRKEARPQELLDAALALFVEKGFAAARSEEVATRAGVSKGTLYLYFPSKEELFKAVVRQNLSTLIAEGQEMVHTFEGSTSELLTCLMGAWWQRVAHTPASGIFKVMMSEARNFPDLAAFYVEEVVRPAERLLGSALERGVQRGEFRALPAMDVVHVLIAPVLFLAMHKHSLGACGLQHTDVDADSFIDTMMQLVLRGLELTDRPSDADPTLRMPGCR
jgi:AcrR family transcriptional regulator